MGPLFSIVIANYNYGRFLEDAIKSVLSQGMGGQVELIICDAASTDNSVEVIKKYANQIAWWCSEKDGGQSAAFNKGFSHAKGRFLTWLNADDVLFPGALMAIAREIARHPNSEWFVGSSIWCDANLFVRKVFRAHGFSRMRLKTRNLSCCGPSSFFTKRLLDAAGGFDESMHYIMDNDLWYRFALQLNMQYRRVKEFVWVYRFHQESKMAGRVVDPNSEQTKKRAPAIRMEDDLIRQRYGSPIRLSKFLNKFPVSLVDTAAAAIKQCLLSGKHLNAICKGSVSMEKILLSNSILEYMTGLREIPVEVYAFNNWGRKKFADDQDLVFLEKVCETDARQCAEYAQKNGITVLYAQGLRSLMYFSRVRRLCSVKPRILVNCHSPALWDSPWKSLLLIVLACLWADGFVFLVEKTRRKWRLFCSIFGLATYHVPNPVDMRRFGVVKQHSEGTSVPIVMGCIGTIGPRKRQEMIVDIVKALRLKGYDARASIVGEPSNVNYKDSIINKIHSEQLDEFIKVEAVLDYDKVPQWMQSLDMYICPSDAEVMPFSILEAIASGLPVVAHDIAGISEEVSPGLNGALVENQVCAEYVEACETVIQRREEYGRNSRALAQDDFSTIMWANRMATILGVRRS